MTAKQNESQIVAGYGGKELPLAGYAGLVGVYTAGFAAFLLAAKSRRRDLPERVGLGPGDTNELKEKPRGEGMQRAVGDLVTCPWCLGPWAAAALAYGFVLAPRATRLAAVILSATAISDALHLGHDALMKEAK